jgi:glycosyltransferase involved in cell wall biosynthesis
LDHVVHGQNGLLYPPDDQEALVALTQSLAADLERARRLGQAGRRYVETQSWEASLDTLLEKYQGLVEQGPRTRQPRSLRSALRPSWLRVNQAAS